MAKEHDTVLAAQASFDGKLEGLNVTLEGSFRGEIKASGTVRIVEGSEVSANVHAGTVEIGGRFQGDIQAEVLRLLGPARASGTFRANKLSVEEGGQLDGDFEIGDQAKEPVATDAAV